MLPETVNPQNPTTVAWTEPADILKAEVAAKGAYNGLFLALGAVALAHMFSPEVIIIGGGLGDASQALRETAEKTVAAHGPRGLPRPISVLPALLGDDAGLQGAAAWDQATDWLSTAG